MVFIGILAQTSFVPQMWRMFKRKSSDDFSLWTSAILLLCNASWLYYSWVISDFPSFMQQALTVFNIGLFAAMIVYYRFPIHTVRGLVWPILGGWGPSDPGSNPGDPLPSHLDVVIDHVESPRRL